MIWYILLGFLLGGIVAVVVSRIFMSKRTHGTLHVYIPDYKDEPPYLFVELDKPVASICGKKRVQFKVNTKNLNSQK